MVAALTEAKWVLRGVAVAEAVDGAVSVVKVAGVSAPSPLPPAAEGWM